MGYLGTIEMPVAGDTGAVDESAMRSCIRRLRLEKRVHTRDDGCNLPWKLEWDIRIHFEIS